MVDTLVQGVDAGEYIHVVPMSPTAVRPFVLPGASYDEIFRATVALLGLLRRTLLEAAPTAAGRIAALGADERMYPLFMDGAIEEDYAACSTRPDVVVDATGPKFVEFNIGSGIGGVVDTSLHSAAWIAGFGGADRAPFRGADPLAVRADSLVRAVKALDLKPAVAIVGTTRDLKGHQPTRYYDVQLAHLRKRGVDAEFFEPEDLLDGLGLPGSPRYQLGLRHFTIPEWRALGIDLSPLRTALDAGCRLIATQTAYLIANKKVLGWVSEGRSWMTDKDRETVERYLPWTRVVSDRPTRWRGVSRSLPELLIQHPEEFVLKPAIGMSGQNVLVGRACDPVLWRATVNEAAATESYIVQEYVEPAPYVMEFADGEGTGTYEAEVLPVYSPFVFDNRPAGCMVRYLAPGQEGVVSVHGHRALSSVAFARR
ncbi:hypothetical protein [Streptomyces inhibens]|uniref:hypothetical protein n=1 Tax=Streptomyces inhibens TaxID=2293571 RepID=UPI001EE6BE8A|nr:hypothetical protein [Streptomyces inhibens]UKY54137.1 hypothetical protein KI385_38570 [Streptomyces inhibens]